MLKMVKGSIIKDFEKLNEEFETKNKGIITNINEDKILKIIDDFIEIQEGYLFLIIEIPTNAEFEENGKNLHKDVYYKDGMTKEEIKKVMKEYGNLFVQDGIAQIGVGNHETKEEIMTDKYNIVYIYAEKEEQNKYEKILLENKVKKVDKLTTAWDYFTKENGGISNIIEEDGKNVYDVVEILKEEIGLYFAERREES